MTKSAALEYAARGIRINAVCPGTMVAEMLAKEPKAMKEILRGQPIGRLGRAMWPQAQDVDHVWVGRTRPSTVPGYSFAASVYR
jgi:NAD(P)-dependent dehydrogenase (short-subunit alcohol dehydrogenase family)